MESTKGKYTRREIISTTIYTTARVSAFGYAAYRAGKGIHANILRRDSELRDIEDPRTGDARLMEISKSEDDDIRANLAARQFAIPKEAQMNLSKDFSLMVLSQLSKRENLSPDVSESIANNNRTIGIMGDYILADVARQKLLHQATIDKIAHYYTTGGVLSEAQIELTKRDDISTDSLLILVGSLDPNVKKAAKEGLGRKGINY